MLSFLFVLMVLFAVFGLTPLLTLGLANVISKTFKVLTFLFSIGIGYVIFVGIILIAMKG